MSTHFSLLNNQLIISKPENSTENLDSLSELLAITQRISDYERVHEAVQTEQMSIKLVCNFSKKSWNLLNHDNYETIRQVVANFLNSDDDIYIPYVIMKRHGEEIVVCQLTSLNGKPFWKVVRASNFSCRELSYLINTLKEAGIFSFTKITRPT
jgi:hypothetical protein